MSRRIVGVALGIVLLSGSLWGAGVIAPAADRLEGASADVLDRLATRVAREAPRRGVIILGEDHRSPIPDEIASRLLERGAADCLLLELPVELQPAIDQYAVGATWQRTVRAALRFGFDSGTPAQGQDRLALRAARRLGVRMIAIDRLSRTLTRAASQAQAMGLPPTPSMQRALIDDRDAAMVEHIRRLTDDGACQRPLYTVGWNHVPGLVSGLTAQAIPAWAVVVEHRSAPPVPPRLRASWVDGVLRVAASDDVTAGW